MRISTSLFLLAALVSCQFSVPLLKPTAPLLTTQNVFKSTDLAHDGEADMRYMSPRQSWNRSTDSSGLKLSGTGQLLVTALQGRWTSEPQPLPIAAQAVLPAWYMPVPTGVQYQWQIRFSPDRNQWGSWLPLLKEKTLFWPKPARYFQYQLLIESASRTPQPFQLQDLSLQFGNQGPMGTSLRRNRVPHSIPKPAVMSREDWKAVPPREPYTPHTPDGIVVHHTWQPDQAHYRKEATIRGIQRFHMEDRKWNDIGYHFLIGPEGVIYQGRPETVLGSHSVPNTGKVGICIIGDYDPDKDPFTAESFQSLVDLMTWLTAEYQISPGEFYGHRNFSTKSCPGDSVYNRLEEIREEVKRRLAAAGIPIPIAPAPPPSVPTPAPTASAFFR